jgi:hypothetical protein
VKDVLPEKTSYEQCNESLRRASGTQSAYVSNVKRSTIVDTGEDAAVIPMCIIGAVSRAAQTLSAHLSAALDPCALGRISDINERH